MARYRLVKTSPKLHHKPNHELIESELPSADLMLVLAKVGISIFCMSVRHYRGLSCLIKQQMKSWLKAPNQRL